MNKESPLVTIRIITYNSSKYILDALESVKKQTYQNIELIVSDDCSTDNTVAIVAKWLNTNANRFQKIYLLTSDTNGGVATNVNKARKVGIGEWSKDFAGDDVLFPTCIEDNVTYIQEHPDAQIVLSNSLIFFDDKDRTIVQLPGEIIPGFFEMNASEQYESLILKEVLMNSNSVFAKTSLYRNYPVNERFRYMEDRPFFWDITSHGIKIHYFDKLTVKYRKHIGALTGLSDKNLISLDYCDSRTDFYYLVGKPEMEKRGLSKEKAEKQVLWFLFVKYVLKNKNTFFNRIIHKLAEKWIIK